MSCVAESDEHWNYDNPSEWIKHFPSAGGSSQSPININVDETIEENFSPFVFSSKYFSDELFTLTNNGHQVAVRLAEHTYGQEEKDLSFTGGGLDGVFTFVNFHLHWGRHDRHGSEHEINGHWFPAEAHIVFKNVDTDQLAVFGLFFKITDDDSTDENVQWEKYADAASELKHLDETIHCIFNLSELMPTNDRRFFRYEGSLTTPPCTEGVIWTIYADEMFIKESSLNKLRRNVMRKVYRPIQSLNNRMISRNLLKN